MGFKDIPEERRKEIAARGGAAVKADKRSFAFDKKLAREAGKKGGKLVPADKRSFSKNKELAREAGRKGGLASQKRRAEAIAKQKALDAKT